MEAKELMITIVFVAAVAIVGVLIYSNVSNTTDSLFTPKLNHQVNESLTISSTIQGQTNSSVLTKAGFISGSEVVRNASNGALLRRNADYFVTQSQASGDLANTGNITLLNNSMGAVSGFNNTALKVTYDYNTESESHVTKTKVESGVLSAFELGIVGLIVVAAVAILSAVYMIG